VRREERGKKIRKIRKIKRGLAKTFLIF